MTKDILMNFDMWGHWDDFCIQRGKDGNEYYPSRKKCRELIHTNFLARMQWDDWKLYVIDLRMQGKL